jgi:hypothetical protein
MQDGGQDHGSPEVRGELALHLFLLGFRVEIEHGRIKGVPAGPAFDELAELVERDQGYKVKREEPSNRFATVLPGLATTTRTGEIP